MKNEKEVDIYFEAQSWFVCILRLVTGAFFCYYVGDVFRPELARVLAAAYLFMYSITLSIKPTKYIDESNEQK